MRITPYRPSKISLVFEGQGEHLKFKVVVRPELDIGKNDKSIIMSVLKMYAFDRLIPKAIRDAGDEIHESYKEVLAASLQNQIDTISDQHQTGEYELIFATQESQDGKLK